MKHLKTYNESLRDEMKGKEVDVEKFVDMCFLQKNPDEIFTRAWREDEVIPEETNSEKIVSNLAYFMREYLGINVTTDTNLILKVFKYIDKDDLREAMIKTLKEILQKNKD